MPKANCEKRMTRAATGLSALASSKLPYAIKTGHSAKSARTKSRTVLHSVASGKENDIIAEPAELFRSEVVISKRRSSRKLRNITDTLNQLAVAVPLKDIHMESSRKRKLDVEVKPQNDTQKSSSMAPSSSVVDNSDKSDEAAAIAESQEKLKTALGEHYFDVGKRLNLIYIPECLRNVPKCAELHARRTNQARRVNSRRQRDAKELLIENRPVQFLEYLEQALLRQEFIDSTLFVKTLELVMTINPPSLQLNADYCISTVIQQAVDILDRTVEQFPPCWLDLKTAYHGVIFGRLEGDCFMKYDLSEGLFMVVLSLIERYVDRDEEQSVRTVGRERSLASFYLWEQENNQKYDFELLSRVDKLDRLFLVLQILVKIFEMDLAMWILRHPHKTKENMIKPNRQPLIASLLWHEDSGVGEVNALIKRIIGLYVNVNGLNYPEENIQVVSRLISVIGTVINLSEIQYDGTMDYPCIKDNTRYFARQISRLQEASDYYSVSLCLRSIQQMRSPLLRMIMVNDFLHRLNGQLSIASVAFFTKELAKGRWRKCASVDTPTCDGMKTPDTRYPLLRVKPHRKASHEITCNQYVTLLLNGFRSYMEVYPVQSYFHSLKSSMSVSNNAEHHMTTATSPRTPTRRELKSNRYDFTALEKNISKLHKKDKPNQIFVRSSDRKTTASLVLQEINVSPSVLVYYREEIKHLLLIQRWLTLKAGTSQQDQPLFESWKHFMAQIDDTLVCQ
ncbi:uncharacterized protein LOC128736972 [Sabethes cyaneus]|uniref:uncharacterized protein LOC128736972 n=1 Tax=Sabethes cyaneus TaxID=53552 RepID=UPI00237ED99D|nr:uncharacterized protein LOC128736972 [Sabethes cyaneus]